MSFRGLNHVFRLTHRLPILPGIKGVGNVFHLVIVGFILSGIFGSHFAYGSYLNHHNQHQGQSSSSLPHGKYVSQSHYQQSLQGIVNRHFGEYEREPFYEPEYFDAEGNPATKPFPVYTANGRLALPSLRWEEDMRYREQERQEREERLKRELEELEREREAEYQREEYERGLESQREENNREGEKNKNISQREKDEDNELERGCTLTCPEFEFSRIASTERAFDSTAAQSVEGDLYGTDRDFSAEQDYFSESDRTSLLSERRNLFSRGNTEDNIEESIDNLVSSPEGSAGPSRQHSVNIEQSAVVDDDELGLGEELRGPQTVLDLEDDSGMESMDETAMDHMIDVDMIPEPMGKPIAVDDSLDESMAVDSSDSCCMERAMREKDSVEKHNVSPITTDNLESATDNLESAIDHRTIDDNTIVKKTNVTFLLTPSTASSERTPTAGAVDEDDEEEDSTPTNDHQDEDQNEDTQQPSEETQGKKLKRKTKTISYNTTHHLGLSYNKATHNLGYYPNTYPVLTKKQPSYTPNDNFRDFKPLLEYMYARIQELLSQLAPEIIRSRKAWEYLLRVKDPVTRRRFFGEWCDMNEGKMEEFSKPLRELCAERNSDRNSKSARLQYLQKFTASRMDACPVEPTAISKEMLGEAFVAAQGGAHYVENKKGLRAGSKGGNKSAPFKRLSEVFIAHRKFYTLASLLPDVSKSANGNGQKTKKTDMSVYPDWCRGYFLLFADKIEDVYQHVGGGGQEGGKGSSTHVALQYDGQTTGSSSNALPSNTPIDDTPTTQSATPSQSQPASSSTLTPADIRAGYAIVRGKQMLEGLRYLSQQRMLFGISGRRPEEISQEDGVLEIPRGVEVKWGGVEYSHSCGSNGAGCGGSGQPGSCGGSGTGSDEKDTNCNGLWRRTGSDENLNGDGCASNRSEYGESGIFEFNSDAGLTGCGGNDSRNGTTGGAITDMSTSLYGMTNMSTDISAPHADGCGCQATDGLTAGECEGEDRNDSPSPSEETEKSASGSASGNCSLHSNDGSHDGSQRRSDEYPRRPSTDESHDGASTALVSTTVGPTLEVGSGGRQSSVESSVTTFTARDCLERPNALFAGNDAQILVTENHAQRRASSPCITSSGIASSCISPKKDKDIMSPKNMRSCSPKHNGPTGSITNIASMNSMSMASMASDSIRFDHPTVDNPVGKSATLVSRYIAATAYLDLGSAVIDVGGVKASGSVANFGKVGRAASPSPKHRDANIGNRDTLRAGDSWKDLVGKREGSGSSLATVGRSGSGMSGGISGSATRVCSDPENASKCRALRLLRRASNDPSATLEWGAEAVPTVEEWLVLFNMLAPPEKRDVREDSEKEKLATAGREITTQLLVDMLEGRGHLSAGTLFEESHFLPLDEEIWRPIKKGREAVLDWMNDIKIPDVSSNSPGSKSHRYPTHLAPRISAPSTVPSEVASRAEVLNAYDQCVNGIREAMEPRDKAGGRGRRTARMRLLEQKGHDRELAPCYDFIRVHIKIPLERKKANDVDSMHGKLFLDYATEMVEKLYEDGDFMTKIVAKESSTAAKTTISPRQRANFERADTEVLQPLLNFFEKGAIGDGKEKRGIERGNIARDKATADVQTTDQMSAPPTFDGADVVAALRFKEALVRAAPEVRKVVDRKKREFFGLGEEDTDMAGHTDVVMVEEEAVPDVSGNGVHVGHDGAYGLNSILDSQSTMSTTLGTTVEGGGSHIGDLSFSREFSTSTAGVSRPTPSGSASVSSSARRKSSLGRKVGNVLKTAFSLGMWKPKKNNSVPIGSTAMPSVIEDGSGVGVDFGASSSTDGIGTGDGIGIEINSTGTTRERAHSHHYLNNTQNYRPRYISQRERQNGGENYNFLDVMSPQTVTPAETPQSSPTLFGIRPPHRLARSMDVEMLTESLAGLQLDNPHGSGNAGNTGSQLENTGGSHIGSQILPGENINRGGSFVGRVCGGFTGRGSFC